MKLFFPPRLIDTDDSIKDSNDRLDDAVEKYNAQGIAILVEQSGLKDAMKVSEFCEPFEDLARPCD